MRDALNTRQTTPAPVASPNSVGPRFPSSGEGGFWWQKWHFPARNKHPALPLCGLANCDTLVGIRPEIRNPLWEESSVNRRFIFARTAFFTLLMLTAVGLLAAPGPEKSAGKKPAKGSSSALPAAQTPISVDGVADIDPAKAFGSRSAPVVMEVFSDFQCPACRQLFLNTTQRVMDNYVNTGKIFLVHRDFPLPMHAYSRVAALYSRAAAHIGKCEEVEQALFQNQEKWEMNGDVKGTVAAVLGPADMKKVQALVDSGTLEPLIEKDRQIGLTVPVNQTPTTVIHTKDGKTFPFAGFVSYDVLKTGLLDQVIK